MALTEKRITIRLHYIYSGLSSKGDRARLGHWFIYLSWGCRTRFALGTSVTCDSDGRDSKGCSSELARVRQTYFTSEWLETQKHQNNSIRVSEQTECVLTEDKTILRLESAQWPYTWEHKLVTKVEKINYFVSGTSKTYGELRLGDQIRTFMFENIQTQFEQANSSFQSQPGDSLQSIMALHYTHAHTSYRPFWPPFSPIILLNRAVGVLRDGVIIPPLWHRWPHFQLQSPFTAVHVSKHLIADPRPRSLREF